MQNAISRERAATIYEDAMNAADGDAHNALVFLVCSMAELAGDHPAVMPLLMAADKALAAVERAA